MSGIERKLEETLRKMSQMSSVMEKMQKEHESFRKVKEKSHGISVSEHQIHNKLPSSFPGETKYQRTKGGNGVLSNSPLENSGAKENFLANFEDQFFSPKFAAAIEASESERKEQSPFGRSNSASLLSSRLLKQRETKEQDFSNQNQPVQTKTKALESSYHLNQGWNRKKDDKELSRSYFKKETDSSSGFLPFEHKTQRGIENSTDEEEAMKNFEEKRKGTARNQAEPFKKQHPLFGVSRDENEQRFTQAPAKSRRETETQESFQRAQMNPRNEGLGTNSLFKRAADGVFNREQHQMERETRGKYPNGAGKLPLDPNSKERNSSSSFLKFQKDHLEERSSGELSTSSIEGRKQRFDFEITKRLEEKKEKRKKLLSSFDKIFEE